MTALAVHRRPTYEDLEAENAWLRERLEVELEHDLVAAVQDAFEVAPTPASILLILHRTRRVCSRYFLLEALGKEDIAEKIIDVWVCKIRKLAGPATIRNHWGVGFSLGDQARARIDGVLAKLEGAR